MSDFGMFDGWDFSPSCKQALEENFSNFNELRGLKEDEDSLSAFVLECKFSAEDDSLFRAFLQNLILYFADICDVHVPNNFDIPRCLQFLVNHTRNLLHSF